MFSEIVLHERAVLHHLIRIAERRRENLFISIGANLSLNFLIIFRIKINLLKFQKSLLEIICEYIVNFVF